MKKLSLLDNLINYSHSDYYPFHMPGHKRTPLGFPDPWSIDITEIDGFDNLHHAEGILKDLQEQAARLFGARRSFCLVNGSTCGILTAISACVKPGGRLLMARNCHKSAYHGVYLRNITPVYVMPEATDFGIMGSLSPDTVARALEEHPDVQAVLVVSPTYDGVVSDIDRIAQIAHVHGIPLIVDEAHGAHLPLAGKFPAPASAEDTVCSLESAGSGADSIYFPASALACGADIVIHSLHKTLPAFTQTALLHINSDLVDETAIRRFLGIYQSSSPSYLLMASMDQCFHLLEEDGQQLFAALRQQLWDFYRKCDTLTGIRLFSGAKEEGCFAQDPSKLLISAEGLGLSGQALYHILLENYHLQFEMASGHYALALASLMDRPEGFSRLFDALAELDKGCNIAIRKQNTDLAENHPRQNIPYQQSLPSQQSLTSRQSLPSQQSLPSRQSLPYQLPRQAMTISEALEQPGTAIRLEDSAGAVSQEYLYLYPPGIPLLAPGERIDARLLADILSLKKTGLPLEGLSDMTNTMIRVVKG